MKAFIAFLLVLAPFTAFATVDAVTSVWIVVQNDQDSKDFSLQRAPLLGCFGLPQGPQLVQWTAPYEAPANIGCGGPKAMVDLNALSCGKVIQSKESEDYLSFSEITLDISKCEYKNNKRFITMVKKSAARNFPQSDKSKEVVLNIVK